MGFLLGLPLKLLALVFGLLRVLIPVLLLILVVRWLWRKYGGHKRSESDEKRPNPTSKGRCIPWTTRKSRTMTGTRNDPACRPDVIRRNHAVRFLMSSVVIVLSFVLRKLYLVSAMAVVLET